MDVAVRDPTSYFLIPNRTPACRTLIPLMRASFFVIATLAVGVAIGLPCRADVQLTVNKAGGAQFTSVQAAVNTVPANAAERYVIRIAPGTYAEQLSIA